MTTIEVETNEMKKCQGDDVEHYKIHIGHLQEEREAYIQEAENIEVSGMTYCYKLYNYLRRQCKR